MDSYHQFDGIPRALSSYALYKVIVKVVGTDAKHIRQEDRNSWLGRSDTTEKGIYLKRIRKDALKTYAQIRNT